MCYLQEKFGISKDKFDILRTRKRSSSMFALGVSDRCGSQSLNYQNLMLFVEFLLFEIVDTVLGFLVS